jgi:hypothetical protein
MIDVVGDWLAIVAVVTVATATLALLIFPQPHEPKARYPWETAPKPTDGVDYRHVLLTFVALSMLGASAGVVGGLSRVGVAGQIIPAALTFLGVVGLYLFMVKGGESGRVALGVIALVGSLFVGYMHGAQLRNPIDQSAYWRNTCVEIYTRPLEMNETVAAQIFGPICGAVLKRERQSFGID